MQCGRCGKDTEVTHHDIDGFSGYLCEDCEAAWKLLQDQ